MCDSNQQLRYVLSEYYQGQDQNPSVCGFSRSVAIRSVATPTGSCLDALSSVGFSTSGGGGAGGGGSTQSTASSISTVVGMDIAICSLGSWLE